MKDDVANDTHSYIGNITNEENKYLADIGKPHVDSFNDMLNHGLKNAVKYMNPVSFKTFGGEYIKLCIESISIARPQVPFDVFNVKTRTIYPIDAKQLKETYSGMCAVRIGWYLNGEQKPSIDLDVGPVPVMVKSEVCNLATATPREMIQHGEHASDWGGVFIIHGNEKVIRMILTSKRNYPMAIKRPSWQNCASNFTNMGIFVRSVRQDSNACINILHYLTNGTAKLMLSENRVAFYTPICLILKSLCNYTDYEIYKRLSQGYENDQYYLDCIQAMLREVHEEDLHTFNDCRRYLGEVFRKRCHHKLPEWASADDIATYILNNLILMHLDTFTDKFDMLVFMTQKLFQCAQGNTCFDNPDSIALQEVLTPGHLYQLILCDRINVWLLSVKKQIIKEFTTPGQLSSSTLHGQLRSYSSISKSMESFMGTGNLPSRASFNISSTTGIVIHAENINRLRYMSNFRAIHRGSFFTTLRTTEVRQLLPEAWGFVCPVHTPDGTLCGLLNHLTVSCKISTIPDEALVQAIPKILVDIGMIDIDLELHDHTRKYVVVFLEGKFLGHVRQIDAENIVSKLRSLKVQGVLPEMTEIGYIPYKKKAQFPGIFIFVGPGRMMRSVKNLSTKTIEYIGSLEQVYMDIAINAKEFCLGFTTHMELSETEFLSHLANLIPFPDYNQSPRNMYQCQMAKQTMGIPCFNWLKQSANKLYRLQTPMAPLFRTKHYDNMNMDEFPTGSNAIIAIVSYTGYDMEDAMIINKFSDDRGFAYGSIYKYKFITLSGTNYFVRSPHMPELSSILEQDGLPQIGTKLSYKAPLYCYYDTDESNYKVVRFDENEDCFVDSIRYCGSFTTNAPRVVCITLRIPRPTNIGDKFASRAGQKGICSQKCSAENLPFSETGLIPDIVFNPHGFPSRMTIAMMIETMAGKSAALHGNLHDATPFRFSEKNTAIDHFGKLLHAAGYNYYGTEVLYSGVDGRELTAEIFFGIVHYQRLRHMVSDKWQVRSTGPINPITKQPVKGRARGGGVRFGEMERDSLLSHGAAYLLQDRLLHNSDHTLAIICQMCGSLLSPLKKIIQRNAQGNLQTKPGFCLICKDKVHVQYIEIPYCFKYLVAELSSVNINVKLKLVNI